MKTIIRIFLVISLAANCWLFFRSPAPAAVMRAERSDRVPPATKREPWLAALDTAEPDALRDLLRAAGADDNTVRGIVWGVLHQRYTDKLAALRIERARMGWWRAGRSMQADDSKLLKTMVSDPMGKLFSRDPFAEADAESRYGFLPPDKRRLLAQIDLDYTELLAGVPRASVNNELQSEVNEQRLLIDERRKDVLAALTPAERAEYDLRYSGTAGTVAWRMDAMQATESEYRALKPAMDDFDQKSRAIAKDANFSTAYDDLQRVTMEQVVAQIGYDRAMAFVWSGNDYAAVVRAAQAAGLPPATAGQVMQLATETGESAARIHDDASLSIDQKRAALVALQQSVRVQFDQLLPPAAQQQLPSDALPWLKALGEGRYFTAMPSFLSSPGYMVFLIASPPPAKRMVSPLILPRPVGK